MDLPVGDAVPEVLRVSLLGVPLALLQVVREHHAEFMRELALLALTDAHPTLPGRLRELVDTLSHGSSSRFYGGATVAADVGGVASGYADMVCRLPRSAAVEANGFWALVEEAQQFCGSGNLFLTMPGSPRERDFLRWYFGEFARQGVGGAPTPFADTGAHLGGP